MKSKKFSSTEKYEDIYKHNFSFGNNWKNLLSKINSERIILAKKSLSNFTGLESFKGKVFLDFGCGSGLFSLAAVKLGAKKVISVDIDDNSLYCTHLLRDKYKVNPKDWVILKGSALDENFVLGLPKADITYSWGVLHHTGQMYPAIDLVSRTVKKKGLFYLAIYNDFRGIPFSSRQWVWIKKRYNKAGTIQKKLIKASYVSIIIAGLLAHLRNPISYINNYSLNATRGMDFFIDVEDWLGGYPYEFASSDEIVGFCRKKGFELRKLKSTNREGCNEFLFFKK